jgi:hypothetical protein
MVSGISTVSIPFHSPVSFLIEQNALKDIVSLKEVCDIKVCIVAIEK